jgi:UDP-N-acetylmuramate--alanine ligase
LKELKDIQEVYFIGIGGIGMSALARYFNFHGKKVSGYDKTETVLTKQLVEEGIAVHYVDNIDLASKQADIIVYTPAIPKDHKELNYYQSNNYPLLKRSDVLGLITNGSFNVCVAGTHGKTTITTMIAHLFRDSGFGCNAFLGGIAVNYNSNFWSHEKNVCVVEADEYDRSFLKLSPDIAVITAMDADHLDIYGTAESMEQAFIDFSAKLKPGGVLFSKFGLPKGKQLKGDKRKTYAQLNDGADIYATNIKMDNGSYEFDVVAKDWMIDNVQLHMGGMHNVENVTAAIAVAHEVGISNEKIRSAVASFKGVKRRFEYIIKREDFVFVDDYAHHPEELRVLIGGAKSLFSDRKCTVIFQPHLFSRTRDFVDGFAESLDLADEVVLLPIYPARELPIEGVSSKIIFDRMKNSNKKMMSKPELMEWISKMTGNRTNLGRSMVITAGAGDIDAMVQPIREIFNVLD